MTAVRALCLTIVLASLASPALAFRSVRVGEKISSSSLRTLTGEKAPFLEPDRVNVFIFFRPKQAFSEEGLEKIARLQERLKDRPVAWTAIVSDWYPPGQVRELISRVGFEGRVLIDAGDSLYGRLGVAVHPMTGITDRDRLLTTDVSFRKINFEVIVEANLLHTLAEIDDAELAARLDPPEAKSGGDPARARRNLKMGEMLFKMKKREKALEIARKSLELDPDLAAAHGLIAAVHAAAGDCQKAAPALARALKLDPEEPRALEARTVCAGAKRGP